MSSVVHNNNYLVCGLLNEYEFASLLTNKQDDYVFCGWSKYTKNAKMLEKVMMQHNYSVHKFNGNSTTVHSVLFCTNSDNYIYSLIKRIVDLVKNREKILVIINGGDGTISKLITNLTMRAIRLDSLSFFIVPCGTGNDLYNSIGNANLSNMKITNELEYHEFLKTVYNYNNYRKVDVWDIEINTNNGYFMQIRQTDRVKHLILDNATLEPITKLKVNMINYFSTGTESRVGIGFDKYKRRCPMINKMIYAYEGTKKQLFHRNTFVNSYIKFIKSNNDMSIKFSKIFDTEVNKINDLFNAILPLSLIIARWQKYLMNKDKYFWIVEQKFSLNKYVATDDDSDYKQDKNYNYVDRVKHAYRKIDEVFLNIINGYKNSEEVGKYLSVVFTNIPYFATLNLTKLFNNEPINKVEQLKLNNQQLRVVAVKNLFGFAMGKISTSISQKFKLISDLGTTGNKINILADQNYIKNEYFQIDGEYYIGHKISSIDIQYTDKIYLKYN